MAQDLRLVLKITGDASGLKAEIVGAKQQIDTLGPAGGKAGSEAARGIDSATSSLGDLAATAGRALAALGGIASIGGAMMAVARAGDQATQSLEKLKNATGSIAAARDVYDALSRSAAVTGVAVSEGVAAFQRFAIAGREIGATNAQVLRLVDGLQRVAIVSGASAQESGSAMLQLGQALASGVLQGDELRSVLEAMPALAEALAGELGVSIGELRKLGSEGKLTADTVFPALLRATERLGASLADAPLSLDRAFGQLRVATTGFLEQLDAAVGLSARLAQGLSGAAGALNQFRQGAGLLTDAERMAQMRGRADALGAAIGRAEAAPGGDSPSATPRRGSIQAGLVGAAAGQAGATPAADLATMRAEYFALRAEIDTAERDAIARNIAEAEAAEGRRAAMQRERAQAELTTLRETLNRREVITREAADRRALIERGVATGAQTPVQGAVLRAQVDQREREELAKLDEAGRGAGRAATGPTATRAAEGVARVAQENDRARESFDRLVGSLDPVQAALQQHAQAHDTISAAMARGVITEEEFRAAVDRSREALGQRLQRAQDDADGTADAQKRVADGARSLGLSFTSAFEDSIIEGKKLGDVLKSLEQDLARIVLRKAVTEPLANAATTGISGIFRSLTSGGTAAAASAATPAIDASAGGFLFHTGGVAGHDAAPARQVPASLFSTAPRYHAGGMIGPDEVPAILQRGEGVFTAAQMARLGPSGGSYTFAPVVNFNGDAGRSEDRDALLAGMRSLWVQDIRAAVPGIVEGTKASLRSDVQRMGTSRALGAA